MPKVEYIQKSFREDTLELIDMANTIIENYQSRGYELTLRQLYYQLVARDYIPNTEKSYNKLGAAISDARDAGLVDWNAIVDRTRQRESLTTWSDPGEIIQAAYEGFRIDKWENQPYRVFVWVEKEALAGVINRACFDEDVQVDYVSCRGYMSASTIWREAQNIRNISRNHNQIPVVIHLGDHDPSGIDMTRDNLERLELYSGLTAYRKGAAHNSLNVFELKRIALNMNQIEEYNPPPNPAKVTDSRAGKYIEVYGKQSWELDALDPDVLVNLVQDTIANYRDDDLWEDMLQIEREYKNTLKYVSQNWQLNGNGSA